MHHEILNLQTHDVADYDTLNSSFQLNLARARDRYDKNDSSDGFSLADVHNFPPSLS